MRERHEFHSETTGSPNFATKNAHRGAKKKAASEWRKLKAAEGWIDLFDVQISTFMCIYIYIHIIICIYIYYV